MTAYEALSLVMSAAALIATVFIGIRQWRAEAPLREHQLEAAKAERAARSRAALLCRMPETASGGRYLHIENTGGATAVDLEIGGLHYPHNPDFNATEARETRERSHVPRLEPGQEWTVPLLFMRERLRPPLRFTLTWTDEPTGEQRSEVKDCGW